MHNIEYQEYDFNVNKKKVQKEWDEYVAMEDSGEGASGLPNPIIWNDSIIYSSREKAEEKIKMEDHNRWYNCMAVPFRKLEREPTSKPLEALLIKKKSILEKKNDYEREHPVNNTESEFITCSNCGSKLKKEFVKTNNCPLCNCDLRKKSVLNAVNKFNISIEEIDKKIENMRKELTEKKLKHATIKWLLKIEYHT